MLGRGRFPPQPPGLLVAAAALFRQLSRVAPPPDSVAEPVIRVSNNVARLGPPKEGPKPRQLLSLPPFPSAGVDPLPGRKRNLSCGPANVFRPRRVTAITWVKHYFDGVPSDVIQSHFNKGMVHVELPDQEDCFHQMHHRLPKLRTRPLQ